MRLAQYRLSAALSIAVTLLSFALLVPLWLYPFADANGYLPRWLRWFQPPDNPIWGDDLYALNQGAGRSRYIRSVMFTGRNPAQGLDSALGAWYPLHERPVVVGNLAVSDVGGVAGECLITLGGYFHHIRIIPIPAWLQWVPFLKGKCINWQSGWRIHQIAQDYEAGMRNPMTRQLVAPVPRLFRFGV